jgi:hypothetical protein
MSREMRELLMTARRWVMWLDEPTVPERQAWLDEVETALNPPRTPCPICPHWMEVHNPDGTCGCGAHG